MHQCIFGDDILCQCWGKESKLDYSSSRLSVCLEILRQLWGRGSKLDDSSSRLSVYI